MDRRGRMIIHARDEAHRFVNTFPQETKIKGGAEESIGACGWSWRKEDSNTPEIFWRHAADQTCKSGGVDRPYPE